MNIIAAKQSLDKVINKARVHLYKPIQVAEILYRDRTVKDINLSDLSTYRTVSKKWRDVVCKKFLGRISTSSARYQDDIFNDNAVPPNLLVDLGKENNIKKGIVEAYIYKKFAQRISQMSTGLDYCLTHDKSNFNLNEFLAMFWNEPGLRRSIDKIYEIVVYSLFSALVEALEVSVEVSLNPTNSDILKEFEDFASRVIQLSTKQTILLSDGVIRDANNAGAINAVTFFDVPAGNYWVALKTRNHLAVISETTHALPNTSPLNFTNESNIMGGLQQGTMVAAGIFALSAGDFNEDGVITIADFNGFALQTSPNFYNNSDFNCDGTISIADFEILQPNLQKIAMFQVR